MNILTGLKNCLQFINDNWTLIIIIIGLSVAIIHKIQDYLKLSNDEKIAVAKSQISEIILKKISDAEEDYAEWTKAGSIKRSQVIDEIFADYPILSKVTNQNELIKWIDEQIDNALITLRKIIEDNTAVHNIEAT